MKQGCRHRSMPSKPAHHCGDTRRACPPNRRIPGSSLLRKRCERAGSLLRIRNEATPGLILVRPTTALEHRIPGPTAMTTTTGSRDRSPDCGDRGPGGYSTDVHILPGPGGLDDESVTDVHAYVPGCGQAAVASSDE